MDRGITGRLVVYRDGRAGLTAEAAESLKRIRLDANRLQLAAALL
jgi:hypothetical protein